MSHKTLVAERTELSRRKAENLRLRQHPTTTKADRISLLQEDRELDQRLSEIKQTFRARPIEVPIERALYNVANAAFDVLYADVDDDDLLFDILEKAVCVLEQADPTWKTANNVKQGRTE